MAKKLSDKQSLSEYTDRELLLTILAHQVRIARQLEYLEQRVEHGSIRSLGPDYTASIEQLTRNNEKTLKEFDLYLKEGATHHDDE